MAGAVVVLAIAGDRQIAVDGQVVIRLTPERPAVKPLAFEPGRPFEIPLQRFAQKVADDPVKSSKLHSGKSLPSVRQAHRKRSTCSTMPFCRLAVKWSAGPTSGPGSPLRLKGSPAEAPRLARRPPPGQSDTVPG